MKTLVVNADDFGLTDGINKGIVKTFWDGILTSASIMTNGGSFEHAASLSKQYPALSVGIHLVLVEEKPVSPPNEVSSLVSKDGVLYKNHREFLSRFLLGRIKIADVEKEFRAQIEKVLRAGIRMTHIDSHQHLHIYPPLLDVALRLAQEYGIKWMRNSYDNNSTPTSLGQYGLALLAKRGKRKIRKTPIQTTDNFLGARLSGRLTENSLIDVLAKLPDGTTEIMCHPGAEDKRALSRYSHWGFNWQGEQTALLSGTVKQRLIREGIVLKSFADL